MHTRSRTNLLSLPYEMIFEIMLKLDPRSGINLCNSCKILNQIGEDDYFRQKKLHIDYGITEIEYSYNSFKETYVMYATRIFFVYNFDCLFMESYFDYEPIVFNYCLGDENLKYIHKKISTILLPELEKLQPKLHVFWIDIESDGYYDHRIILSLQSNKVSMNYKQLSNEIGLAINNHEITFYEDDDVYHSTVIQLEIRLDEIEISDKVLPSTRSKNRFDIFKSYH